MNKKAFDVLERVQLVLDTITPKQQKLAEYILHNYKKAAFFNSTDLAKAAQVSGSTVVRFAETLDYSGFPEMQEALHSIVQMEINSLDMFSDNVAHEDSADYEKFFHQGAESLIKIARGISSAAFSQAVQLIESQKNICVMAFQASACLAEYTSYALGKVRPGVRKVTQWDENLFNALESYTEKDAVLLYAFPRFPVTTLKMARYLHSKNIPIIYVTSNAENSISEFATVTIQLNIKYAAYIDDLAPVIYLSKAIVAAISRNNPKQSTAQLEKFEDFADMAHIFCK